MKIEAATIIEFLDQVKALVEDINLTIRMGDDGFEETVNDQVTNISKAIEVFKLKELTPVTAIDPASKKYGRTYDELHEKDNRSVGENIELYKSELYFAVKRVITDNAGIADCPNDQLMNFIEAAIPDNSKFNKLIYTDQFFYSSMKVIQEIADEIIELRKKAPQQKLF